MNYIGLQGWTAGPIKIRNGSQGAWINYNNGSLVISPTQNASSGSDEVILKAGTPTQQGSKDSVVTIAWAENYLNNYVNSEGTKIDLTDYVKKTDLATVKTEIQTLSDYLNKDYNPSDSSVSVGLIQGFIETKEIVDTMNIDTSSFSIRVTNLEFNVEKLQARKILQEGDILYGGGASSGAD